MRLILASITLLTTLPLLAETLCEAVQSSLVAKLVLVSKHTSFVGGMDALQETASPSLDLNNISKSGALTAHVASDNLVNPLKFTPHQPKNLPTDVLAQNLTMDVVNCYLQVLLAEKRLEAAKVNLRLHRFVLLQVKQSKEARVVHQVAARLALAESRQLSAEKTLHAAKKNYAAIVGKWPTKLVWPRVPANNELPESVGMAVQQGLDNYLTIMAMSSRSGYADIHALTHSPTTSSANKDNELASPVNNHSLVALSDSVRFAWEQWTAAGLTSNSARKRLMTASQLRNKYQAQFKEGKCAPIVFLNAQNQFYQSEIDYALHQNDEILARYRILNSIGQLLPYINSSLADKDDNSDMSAQLLEMDKMPYPYPNYKPLFSTEVVSMKAMQSLTTKAASDASALKGWYIFAGDFTNKANALALVNRLQGLGFMVITQASKQGASVLIGPYEYRRHASKGIKRLKDVAHVQGVLLATRPEKMTNPVSISF